MPSQMNFQALNFGNISQQEAEARRRYYESLGSIGGVVADTGTKVDDYLQRKQREAEDKKKWDNMIAQQEYQKKYRERRDSIADARYENEWNEKQAELRRAETSRMNEHAALEDYQKGFRESFTPEILSKYGPRAQSLHNATVNARSYAEAVARGGELINFMNQQDMMDFQKEQSERSNKQDEQTKIAGNIMNSIRRQESNSKFSFDIQGKLPNNPAELKAYRDEVQANLDFLRQNEQYADYDVGFHDRIKKYKTILDAIDGKLNYKKPPRTWE